MNTKTAPEPVVSDAHPPQTTYPGSADRTKNPFPLERVYDFTLTLECLVHVPILSRLAARHVQRIEFTIPTQTIDRSQTRSIYLSVRRRPTFTFD